MAHETKRGEPNIDSIIARYIWNLFMVEVEVLSNNSINPKWLQKFNQTKG